MRKALAFTALAGILTACGNERISESGYEKCSVSSKEYTPSRIGITIDFEGELTTVTYPAEYRISFSCPDGTHTFQDEMTYEKFNVGQPANVVYTNLMELVRAEKGGDSMRKILVQHNPIGAEER